MDTVNFSLDQLGMWLAFIGDRRTLQSLGELLFIIQLIRDAFIYNTLQKMVVIYIYVSGAHPFVHAKWKHWYAYIFNVAQVR